MATRKEWTLDFLLNAQLNGGFSGAFSKAQAEVSQLGKDIQELQRVQGNIASYQKQAQAMETTKTKLAALQKQHDLLQKEIGETKGATAALEQESRRLEQQMNGAPTERQTRRMEALNQKLRESRAHTAALEREDVKLEQRIRDMTATQERQEQRFNATSARLKEAGVDTANLSQKEAELTGRIKELTAQQERAANGAVSFGSRMAQAFGNVQEALAAVGIVQGLKEIAGAASECVQTAAGLEESMSTVQALSGASAAELQTLTDRAKELGATTKFTATESGDAMGYMAMAGWDTQEMLSGMNGVLNLAAASGEDLAGVSDIVTDSLSAFGLTAADTAHFSDVLAAAATNANTNVSIMGETFKMSASVAGALGYSIEDVATAVGMMANSGVKGSIAGTALKNIFNGLLDGVTLTGSAFGEFDYSAVKANGTMKTFGETIDELRGYFQQMNEAERVQNARTIAGERGYNGLLAILNATDAEYASLRSSIENCSGAAERMAKIRLDNMNGQLTLAKSAWDALKTTVGEQFTPVLKELFRVGADVLTQVNEFAQAHPNLIRGAGAFLSVFTALTGAMAAYVAITKVAALVSGELVAAALPFVGAAAAVAAVTAAVVGFVGAAQDGVPSVKELSEAAQDMGDSIQSANADLQSAQAETLATAQVAEQYIDRLEELQNTLGDSASENQEYQNTLTLLSCVMPELSDKIDLVHYAIDGSTAALRKNVQAWKDAAEKKAYEDYLNDLYDQYNGVLTEAAENSVKLTQAQIQLDAAKKKHADTQAQMHRLEQESLQNGTALGDNYADLQRQLLSAQQEMSTAQSTIDALTAAMDADSAAVDAAQEEINQAAAAIALLNSVAAEQSGLSAETVSQLNQVGLAVNDTATELSKLATDYQNAYAAALESVQGQYALWDEAEDVVAVSAGSINNALQSQIDYWNQYDANLEKLLQRSEQIEGLRDVVAAFADGSSDSVNAIAGMASATDEDLRKMVSKWQTLKDKQDEVSENLADFQTDFSETIQNMTQELTDNLEQLDLSEEARQKAVELMDSYIGGVEDKLPAVQRAYAKLTQAARDALSQAGGSTVVSAPDPTGTELLQRGRRMIPQISNHYADGTSGAAAGIALVGEEGPELVAFHGGERVFPAPQTASLLERASPVFPVQRESGAPVQNIQVTFQLNGNASPETVDSLRNYEEELTEKILDVLRTANTDARRSAYV